MTYRRLASILALLLPALAVPAMVVFSQEGAPPAPAGVRWRTNYNLARKEAQEKKLPLFIDFYGPHCPPCKEMDATSFRDPRVVSILNERCVPLKMNGEVEEQLREALRIRAYPTFLIASSEGQIVHQMEGFKEVSVMLDALQRFAPAAPQPGVDFFVRDFQIASTFVQKGEYARAVSLLRNIIDEGKGQVQVEAQKTMTELNQKANAQLDKARQLQQQGQIKEAVEALTETMRLYPGLAAAKEAGDLVPQLLAAQTQATEQRTNQRNRRAQELLGQARDFYKNREYIPCLDRCEILLASYGDLQEGQEASVLASDIRNNLDWLQSASDTMSDRLGTSWLALSDGLLKKGERQRAEFYLQRVIQAFPGSRQAESAQIRLSQIRGVPPTRVEVQAARP